MLTGLDFFQTEPKLLRESNRLTALDDGQHDVSAKLATKLTTFHPKILIATSAGPTQSLAIVGSGNLSSGGLRTNTECSLYTKDPIMITALTEWFDEEWKNAADLSNTRIKDYERKYKKWHKVVAKLRKEQKEAEKSLEKEIDTVFRERQKAIFAAARYFKSRAYSKAYERRSKAVDRILTILDIPGFEFDKAAWNEFFSIPQLGRLRPTYRDGVFKQRVRLRDGMRYLLDDNVGIRQRLTAILDPGGKFHIRGLGLNIVSKILAVHDSQRWPVFNGPVEKTLRYFGYEPQRGLGRVGRYLKFADAMRSFREDSGAPDVLALDAFFFEWHRKIKQNASR